MGRRMTEKEFEQHLGEVLSMMRQETLPFEGGGEARRKRLAKARRNHLYFAQEYLPHYLYEDPAPFHRQMSKAAQIVEKPVLIVSMGGGAKTTLVTLTEALHAILFKTRHFVVIGSLTEDMAGQLTSLLKLELEENARIRQDFGNLKGSWKWEDTDFATKTGIRVKARGVGQAFRGLRWRQYRPDLVLLDDIEDEASARSAPRTKKALKWLLATVLPRLEARRWRLVLSGNVINRTGVVGTLLWNTEYQGWEKRVYPAETAKGRPTWPARFPRAVLDNLKVIMGHVQYASEMLCNPIDDAHFFRPEMAVYYDASLLGKLQDIVVRIDPSVVSSRNGDYKALVALGRLPDDHREYVCGVWIRHGTIDEMVRGCYAIYDDFQPKEFILEGIAFQRHLKRDFDRMALKRGHQLPIRITRHEENKDLDIERIVAPYDAGDILFCKDVGDTMALLNQLWNWEPKGRNHDDGPDALARAWKSRHAPRKRARFRAA